MLGCFVGIVLLSPCGFDFFAISLLVAIGLLLACC